MPEQCRIGETGLNVPLTSTVSGSISRADRTDVTKFARPGYFRYAMPVADSSAESGRTTMADWQAVRAGDVE